MTKLEMMNYVDEVCEAEGFENAPAYDLIYSECCEGRNDESAKEMIDRLLAEYK